MNRHPEGHHPFDQDRPDQRGVTRPGDYPLHEGKTVHLGGESSHPTHAPDTTAARAKHSHGRLRRAFNKAFPSGTKRGTTVRAGAVAGGIVTGGAVAIPHAEQGGRTAEHVGHDVAAFVTAGPSESVATESPYADTKTTQGEVERSVADAPDPGVTNAVDLDPPTPEDQTGVADTASPNEIATTEPRTGGLPPETGTGPGGVGTTSSSN